MTRGMRYVVPLIALILASVSLYFLCVFLFANPATTTLWELTTKWFALFGIATSIVMVVVSLYAIKKGRGLP